MAYTMVATCILCGIEFSYEKAKPVGFPRKYCPDCKAKRRHEVVTNSHIKTGKVKQPGVGSGKADSNKPGPGHHSYTTGIESYRRLVRYGLGSKVCEVCGATHSNNRKDPSKPLPLCVHHKDKNRLNNAESNLMVVCKRCHQIIHDCEDNLPQNQRAEVKLRKISGNPSSGQSVPEGYGNA